MNIRMKPLAALVALMISQGIFAQENQLEPVVITATRTPGLAANPAADLSIVSQERIELSTGRSLAEVLAQEANVEITSNGGPASTSGLFIRGTKTAQNIVLIDGFKLTNPTNNQAPIESLPLSAFGQIEVMRGAASSLYGSGAMGGAIQLLTRQREGSPAIEGAITLGRYGSYRSEAAYGGTINNTQFNLAVGLDGNQGFSSSNAGAGWMYEDDKDGYARKSFLANLRHELSDTSAIRLSALLSDGRSDFDNGIATGPRPYISTRTQLIGATLDFKPATTWQSEIKVGETRYDYDYRDAGFVFAPKTSSQQLGWLNFFSLPFGKLTLGLEHEHQEVDGAGVSYITSKRDVTSLLGQLASKFDAHNIQLNLRSDDWTGYSPQTTGGLLYAYALTNTWSLTANHGTAFRVPTYDDLYFPCQWWGCSSNPNLKPEKSRNSELGTRYKSGGDELRLLAFRNRISNAIELDAAFVPQNVNAAIDGASISWKHTSETWMWNITYTNQDARDADKGSRLVRRAQNIVTANVEKQLGSWRLGSDFRSQDSRYSTFETPSSRMGGYGLASIYASYAASKEITLQARVDNVTDKQYELVRGYNTQGRSLFLTIRYTPK